MDRFSWNDGTVESQQVLLTQKGVRLYDGHQKTAFDKGKATLTSTQIIWIDHNRPTYKIALPLRYVVLVERDQGSLTKSPKIVMHLSPKDSRDNPGPVSASSHSFIQLSFTEGGQENFYKSLSDALHRKLWEIPQQLSPSLSLPSPSSLSSSSSSPHQPTTKKVSHTGISGIERHMELRRQERDTTISVAFEDLSNLMKKAQEMVMISKNLSIRLKNKQDNVTEDETLQFKQYLMSLGIQDPITKETHGSGDSFYKGLAKQLSEFFEPLLVECGGVMTLTEAYCRVNRARGLELLSPEDLDQACMLFDWLNLPIKMKEFEDGVKVIQLRSSDEFAVAAETEKIVTEHGSLTAEQLAKLIGLSVILAKERVLTAEKLGKLCRDESSEGLKFYPNLFLTRAT